MNADFLNVETINEMNSRLNLEIHKLEEKFNRQVWMIFYLIIYTILEVQNKIITIKLRLTTCICILPL